MQLKRRALVTAERKRCFPILPTATKGDEDGDNLVFGNVPEGRHRKIWRMLPRPSGRADNLCARKQWRRQRRKQRCMAIIGILHKILRPRVARFQAAARRPKDDVIRPRQLRHAAVRLVLRSKRCSLSGAAIKYINAKTQNAARWRGTPRTLCSSLCGAFPARRHGLGIVLCFCVFCI